MRQTLIAFRSQKSLRRGDTGTYNSACSEPALHTGAERAGVQGQCVSSSMAAGELLLARPML